MFKALKRTLKNALLKKKLKQHRKFLDLSTLDFGHKSVLIIDSIIPEYNKDSGSRRLYELIKLMLKHDLKVFLVADKKEYKYHSDYIDIYKNLGVTVYEPSIDENGSFLTKEAFIKRIAPKLQYAWLHRPDVFHKYHKLIRNSNSEVELIFDMVDFHYIRLIREWEQSKAPTIKQDADAYFEMEMNNCKAADTIIAISEADKASLLEHYKALEKMTVIGNIHDHISKGKDFIAPSDRTELLFVGSFRHKPNQDAVLFLKDKIMPLVWESIPDITVNIVGSYPNETIKNLHSDHFKVVGFVEDISAYYKTARVFIAPLLYGAGVKGKIGQSFEYSLPVVTTAVGAEGFDFSPFTDQMIAETPEALAAMIIELYTNDSLFNDISNHSKNILEPFLLNHIESQVKTVLDL